MSDLGRISDLWRRSDFRLVVQIIMFSVVKSGLGIVAEEAVLILAFHIVEVASTPLLSTH